MWAFPLDTVAAEINASKRFCLVPVIGSQPTKEDFGEVRRLFSDVRILPGIEYPLIYPLNRGGVWTINQRHALVPFGGPFPKSRMYHYFAFDPKSLSIVGLSADGTLFKTGHKERHFSEFKLTNIDRPNSITFSSRMNMFVVADRDGLAKFSPNLTNAIRLETNPKLDDTPYGLRDIPEIGALFFQSGRLLFLRYDDGETVQVGRLAPTHDCCPHIKVTPDRTKIIVSTKRTRSKGGVSVELPKNRSIPDNYYRPQHRDDFKQFGSLPARVYQPDSDGRYKWGFPKKFLKLDLGRFVYEFHLKSLDMTLLYSVDRKERGLLVLEDGGRTTPIPLQFDPTRNKIVSIAEMPKSRVAIIFTRDAAYVLGEDRRVRLVPGSVNVGAKFVGGSSGVIPIRKQMLVHGRREAYLVVDSQLSGKELCRKYTVAQ